mmetsp:Transcript_15496/g.35179  ORF Transcript_15496/g.35179 Transcript_15496/m.35179 type:complete len:116 (+) Transcript_15496:2-349(+)
MVWHSVVAAAVREEFPGSPEACVERDLLRWAEVDREALVRGLSRLIWGLWRLSRPKGAVAITRAACLEAGLAPDAQILSVMLMDAAHGPRGSRFGEDESLDLCALLAETSAGSGC